MQLTKGAARAPGVRGGAATSYFVSICTPIPMVLDSELPR